MEREPEIDTHSAIKVNEVITGISKRLVPCVTNMPYTVIRIW